MKLKSTSLAIQPHLCRSLPDPAPRWPSRLRPGSISNSEAINLLLVLSLRVEAGLDAFPGLLEGLPLGALGRVVGAHSHDVGAGEDQDVGHDLHGESRHEESERSWGGGGGQFSLHFLLLAAVREKKTNTPSFPNTPTV